MSPKKSKSTGFIASWNEPMPEDEIISQVSNTEPALDRDTDMTIDLAQSSKLFLCCIYGHMVVVCGSPSLPPDLVDEFNVTATNSIVMTVCMTHAVARPVSRDHGIASIIIEDGVCHKTVSDICKSDVDIIADNDIATIYNIRNIISRMDNSCRTNDVGIPRSKIVPALGTILPYLSPGFLY